MRLRYVEKLDCKHLVAIGLIGEPPEIREIAGPERLSAGLGERKRDFMRSGKDPIRTACRGQRLYALFP